MRSGNSWAKRWRGCERNRIRVEAADRETAESTLAQSTHETREQNAIADRRIEDSQHRVAMRQHRRRQLLRDEIREDGGV